MTPAGVEPELTARLAEKARFHFEVEQCDTLEEALDKARVNTHSGLLTRQRDCGAAGRRSKLEAKLGS